jgi:hypothetical protein
MTHFSSFKSHIFLLLKDLQAPQSFQPSQQEQTLYGLKIGDADIDICCYCCGSAFPATKAYRKVDFESFSMQMHVLFRLNLKVKLSSVVLFSCSAF